MGLNHRGTGAHAPKNEFAPVIARYKRLIERSERSLNEVERDTVQRRNALRAFQAMVSTTLQKSRQLSGIMRQTYGAVPLPGEAMPADADDCRRAMVSCVISAEACLSEFEAGGNAIDAQAAEILLKSRSWKDTFVVLRGAMSELEAKTDGDAVPLDSRPALLAQLELGYALLEQGVAKLNTAAAEFWGTASRFSEGMPEKIAEFQRTLARAAKLLKRSRNQGEPEPRGGNRILN
jgi:hypothetical protein